MKDKKSFNEICHPTCNKVLGDDVIINSYKIGRIKTLSCGASAVAELLQKSNEIRLVSQDLEAEDGDIVDRPLDGFSETGLHCALEILLHDLVIEAERLEMSSHEAARKRAE